MSAAKRRVFNIKPGSVVRLKSGGPTMTVDGYVVETFTWRCVWFDEYGAFFECSVFNPEALSVVR